MKHLATVVTLFLSCTMLAQGPVEFPWNPDSDGDDFIGVNDLMALLGEFDSVFSEEGLYLSEDSLSAMYDAGDMNFVQCQVACHNLPGTWKMPRLREVIVAGQDMWLETPESAYWFYNNTQSWRVSMLRSNGRVDPEDAEDSRGCFCVTKERPKVEYTYCDGGDPSAAAFTQCINEKLASGWYPLSGFPIDHSRQAAAYSTSHNTYHDARTHASFWRWAE